MPALSAYCDLVDLATDTIIAHTVCVDEMVITRTIDAPGTLRVTFPLTVGSAGFDANHTAFIAALVSAWGGPTYRGPIKAYLIRASQDGGAIFDSEAWLENSTINLSPDQSGITIDAKDIGTGLERTYRDRVRFTNVKTQQVLYGAPGTITLDKDALMRPGGSFFHQKGLLGPEVNGLPSTLCRTSLKGAHRVAFTGICDPDIANVLVNIDSNEDTLANQLTALARAATGALALTNSPLPVGIHQHWSVDVVARRLWLGYVGKVKIVTLMQGDPYTIDQTQFAVATIDSIEPSNEQVIAQAGLGGGADNHGLPDGVTVTALCVVRFVHTSTAHDFDNSLLVVGLSTGTEGGGVFYLIDRTLYPMSQRLDVFDICYDVINDRLYAATTNGVITSKVQFSAKPNWPTLGLTDKTKGTYSLATNKVWCPAPGVIFALANSPANGPGGNGLYRYPALGGDADNSFVGYMNWSRYVATGTIGDAAGDDTAMYYIDDSSPFTVWCHRPGQVPAHMDTPLGGTVVGLDYEPISNQVFVRTQAGAIEFSRIAIGSTSLLSANGDDSLGDQFGPLTPAKVIGYPTNPAGSNAINGLPVALLCATERGLFFSLDPTGRGWRPAAGQNGLTDVSASLVAAGMPKTILGRVLTEVWVAGSASIWQSRTGGVFFDEIFADSLDIGPFFNDLAQANGALPFPNQMIGALGTGATGGQAVGSIVQVGQPIPPNFQALADIGGAGTMYPVRPTDPYAPGPAEVYAKRMTELNDTTYRYYDTLSLAPYTQILIQEMPEITADAGRNADIAASELAGTAKRIVQERKQQQVIVNASSQYDVTTAALRFLKGGDLLAINDSLTMTAYDGSEVTIYDFENAPFYVLSYQSTMTPGNVEVSLKVGNLMSFAQSPDDLGLIVAGMVHGRAQELRFRQVKGK